VILHLLPAWLSETMGADDDYLPAAYAADGFIHCSPSDEVMLAVANAYYAGGDEDLVVWDVDESELTAQVRWEPPDPAPPSGVAVGVLFPHVYGPIERRAVVRVRRLVAGPAGGPAYTDYAPID
jgi:uncharacterized protein (DUF952 family)